MRALISLLAAAALSLGSVTVASAQGPNVHVFYGTNTEAGDVVTASIDGESCGEATASAEGWRLDCVDGQNGDTVSFTLNGSAAEQTATWSAGGGDEISLTVSMDGGDDGMDGGDDGMDGGDDGMDGGDDGMDVEPPDTGSAGLVASGGTSLATMLLFGLAALGLPLVGRRLS